MATYKVIAPGFIHGVFHTPNHPSKGYVQVDKPIKPCPSWLQLVKSPTVTARATGTVTGTGTFISAPEPVTPPVIKTL